MLTLICLDFKRVSHTCSPIIYDSPEEKPNTIQDSVKQRRTFVKSIINVFTRKISSEDNPFLTYFLQLDILYRIFFFFKRGLLIVPRNIELPFRLLFSFQTILFVQWASYIQTPRVLFFCLAIPPRKQNTDDSLLFLCFRSPFFF